MGRQAATIAAEKTDNRPRRRPAEHRPPPHSDFHPRKTGDNMEAERIGLLYSHKEFLSYPRWSFE